MKRAIGLSAFVGLTFLAANVHAALTLLTGPPVATPAGNLVVNGSFETGAPAPGAANLVYWATGTTNTPFSSPAGWTSQGAPANYALWGSDQVTGPFSVEGSANLPDGSAGLYFGNGTGVTTSLAPTFNADGTVSFGGTPTFTPKPTYPTPVRIAQAVATNLTPAPSYILSFWVSGEDTKFAPGTPFNGDGIFGLRVSNVLPGNPIQYLTVPSGLSALGMSIRYEYSFTPINPSLPVGVEFLNWGHVDLSPFGGPNLTTELVLDDVIVNAVPEPTSLATVLLAATASMARRKRSK